MSKRLISHELQNEFSFEVLISLLKNGEQNKQVLYAGISPSTTTLGRRVNELEELGLVKVDKQPLKYNVHFVSLTDKGREVAEKILEIEKILSQQ